MRLIGSPWLWFLLSIAAAAAGYFWIVFSQPALPSMKPDDGITTGQLQVTTSPTGALIDLDGRPTGQRTPATLTVTHGKHAVSLTLEGYAVQEKTANVPRNQSLQLFVDMTQ